MVAKTATQVRAGRAVALFAKVQSAKGTAIASFATSDRLWQDGIDIEQGPRINEPVHGMEDSDVPTVGTAYVLPDRPAGPMVVKATPASLQLILQSNFGPFAAGAWTLASQVIDNRWYTLALMEDVAGGTYKVVRLRDAWLHTVSIVALPGMLLLDCQYAAQKQLNEAINAGGVTLPAAPAKPVDQNVIPFAECTFTRDPDTANIDLRFDMLRITINQRLSHTEGNCTGLWEVSKKGPMQVMVELEGAYGDETWTILTNSLAGTSQHYRLTAITDDATPETFTVDLYGLVWNVSPTGHDGKQYNRFKATAIARTDSGGNNIAMTLA